MFVCVLRKWNKEVFGNILEEKKKLEQEMEAIQQKGIQGIFSSDLIAREAEIREDLVKRERQEEILWHHKSRIHWLKEGDKNTHFFHNSLIQRRNRNKIVSLKAQDGSTKVKKEDIEKELLHHFQNLLSEPRINRKEAITKITEAIPRLVPPEKSRALMRPASIEEVEDIVKSMASGKSPGPDGFTADFFQVSWPILGNDIWEVVEESRNSKTILQAFNTTFITLIPKIKGESSTDKFHPISLCNVIYKIISKLIASRLKPILPQIISQE
jgi:hypothetical protein